MNFTKFVYSTFTVAILLIGQLSSDSKAQNLSVQSISTQFVLLEGTAGSTVIVPTSPNVYTLTPGTEFRVRLQGMVNNPNFTDNQRDNDNGDPFPALHNIPLGIQQVVGSLSTSGVNVVNPVELNTFSPPRWAGFGTQAGGFLPSFSYLLDADSDGDLDPQGVGIANTSLELFDLPSAYRYQIGATGFSTIFTGQYSAAGTGTTSLSFSPINAAVYYDNPTNPDIYALEAQIVSSAVFNTSITINVIPEPSTCVLAAMGLVGVAYCALRNRRGFAL